MKRTLFALAAGLLMLTSCSEHYKVQGTSSVPAIEGSTLYLKVFADNEMQVIDSATVTHGRFSFNGALDSTVLVNLYWGEASIMPLVLEPGEVTIDIEETQQTATGTPLNDSLSAFVRRKAEIEYALAEMPRRESRMIMEGLDHDLVLAQLREEADELTTTNDALVSRFIRQNYENVLGPGIFMVLTSTQRYPLLTPQIEALAVNAPPYFLNHPYVKQYLDAARRNKEKMK